MERKKNQMIQDIPWTKRCSSSSSFLRSLFFLLRSFDRVFRKNSKSVIIPILSVFLSLSLPLHAFPLWSAFSIHSFLHEDVYFSFFSNFEKSTRTWIMLICLALTCVLVEIATDLALVRDFYVRRHAKKYEKKGRRRRRRQHRRRRGRRRTSLVTSYKPTKFLVMLFTHSIASSSHLSFSSWCHTARWKKDIEKARDERKERERETRRVTNG